MYLIQWRVFIFLIHPLLEAREKKCTKFRWFLGGWENLVFCFQYLLTFKRYEIFYQWPKLGLGFQILKVIYSTLGK